MGIYNANKWGKFGFVVGLIWFFVLCLSSYSYFFNLTLGVVFILANIISSVLIGFIITKINFLKGPFKYFFVTLPLILLILYIPYGAAIIFGTHIGGLYTFIPFVSPLLAYYIYKLFRWELPE